MPQLNSDQILFVSAAFNVITYIVMVWRRDRKEAKRRGTVNYILKGMVKEYAEQHDIPLNGEIEKYFGGE